MRAIPCVLARMARTAAVLVAVSPCAPVAASTAGSFESFAGHWQGGGTITLGDGSREAIRCKASYAAREDGDAMNIDVDCASDSYRVRILSQLVAQGDTFSGDWQEVTRQAQGSVTGLILGPGEMQADLRALGIEIRLSARATGDRQAIAIRVQGTDVQAVDIALRRR